MLNKFTLQGRIVRNPELRKAKKSGKIFCEFSVAWNYADLKLFQNCIAYEKIAETIAKNFVKGQEIIVSGQLSTQQWTGRDGTAKQQNKLTVFEFHFCGPSYASKITDISEVEYEEITDEELENWTW